MARLLFSLVLGISLGSIFESGQLGSFLALFAGLLLIVMVGFQRRIPYQKRWWYGLALSAVLISTGASVAILKKQCDAPAALQKGQQVLTGIITEHTPTSQKYRLLIDILSTGTEGTGASGKLLVYLDQDEQSASLQPGDILAMEGAVSSIPPTANPHAFNYAAYLAKKQIYHQAFLSEDNWYKIGHRPHFIHRAEAWRQFNLNTLKAHLPGTNEYAVGAALSMGYKAELTEEVTNAYAHTGAMHVLAVSGLHVGIVQMMLSGLLGLLSFRGKQWKIIRTLIILIAIWLFALMAGASPSVLRAASMFSFLSIGSALHRTTNVYNTLAASAFLLLCINPYLLFEVGFQLSYLAVFGIVFFQPRIYRLCYVRNKALDYLWQLVAVSIAAQIATLPISIYYFHQFPVYFVLSGLVAVPAAVLILSLSLFLFCIHWIPVISVLLGKLLYGIVFVTNALIFAIHQLPGGLLEGIWLGEAAVLFLYSFILCLAWSIHTRKYRWMLIGLSCMVAFAVCNTLRCWHAVRQQALVAYAVNKGVLIDYFDGNDIHTLQQNIDERAVSFAASAHRWYRRAQPTDTLNLSIDTITQRWWTKGPFVQLGPYSLVIPAGQPPGCKGEALSVDVMMLVQPPPEQVERWLDCIRPELLIVSKSVRKWNAQPWLEACKKRNIPIHSIRTDGAYTLQN
jgi:competence protein ComEC